MIEIALKILLIASFILIYLEDVVFRMVQMWLYILSGILGVLLHIKMVGLLPALASVVINITLVISVITVAYGYVRLVMKKAFMNVSIGSGDLLFFVLLALAFPSVTYITLFIFSLIFSLVVHTIVSLKKPQRDVPLAGYMAMFYTAIYFVSFFVEPRYLFSL